MTRKRSSMMDELWDDLGYGRNHTSKLAGTSSSYSSYGGGTYHGGGGYRRCYRDHPPLKLPDTELVIYGGSCLDHEVKDADVYIGFDGGMKFTKRSLPWHSGTEFLFKITDMQAPTDAEEFQKLVEWTREQIEAGAKVHCGCIGGHGRTGTFLAALVSTYGEKDAISYVREHYCKKAVESQVQIDFLAKHYGIKPVKGSKSYGSYPSSSKSSSKSTKGSKKTLTAVPARAAPPPKTYSPIVGMGSIWGQEARN